MLVTSASGKLCKIFVKMSVLINLSCVAQAVDSQETVNVLSSMATGEVRAAMSGPTISGHETNSWDLASVEVHPKSTVRLSKTAPSPRGSRPGVKGASPGVSVSQRRRDPPLRRELKGIPVAFDLRRSYIEEDSVASPGPLSVGDSLEGVGGLGSGCFT